ncbi:MAG: hypothetical protein HYZ84_03055 [Candidatus Omnitrophica bacterium]|nr:hypothetical protein [Candidatus Omnitrophota bacterium]
MIPKLHPSLTIERWRTISLDKRLLHILSELGRAKNWIQENNQEYANLSLERALELIDLTIESGVEGKSRFFPRELLRLRKTLAEVYVSPSKDYEEFLTLMKSFMDLDPSIHNLNLQI